MCVLCGAGRSKRKTRQIAEIATAGDCGDSLEGKRWHKDHFEPVRRFDGEPTYPERDHIDNIVPACAPCNLFKSVFDIDELRREIEQQVERARQYSVNFRTAERFGLVQIADAKVEFYFEKMGLKKA